MALKSELRQMYLLKRKKQSEKEKQKKSKEIAKKLSSLDVYKKAKSVMFYVSLENEVFTDEMIINALKNKRVLVPRTIIKNREIEAIEITQHTKFEKNSLNIPEPKEGKAVLKEDIDIIIIPAVAFDMWGHRIGYGQGYYDRFCRGTKAKKIGLAYDFQIDKKIPHESHDLKADMVITEKRTIRFERDN